MSTPEQPLTRKQMREHLRTGAIPIIRPVDEPEAGEADAAARPAIESVAEARSEALAPIPDDEVDLDAAPLTRREARQQERLRTASVPVISPELAAAALAAGQDEASNDADSDAVADGAEVVAELDVEADAPSDVDVEPQVEAEAETEVEVEVEV
ncbi:MAG TPA: hypothetical protein PKV54_01255, partial [Microbacteriaceae bacterium]|nr:hypothetical protein [Microbacteriaceae bacterium]